MSANHPALQQRKAGTHDRTEKPKSSTGSIRSGNTVGCAHSLMLTLSVLMLSVPNLDTPGSPTGWNPGNELPGNSPSSLLTPMIAFLARGPRNSGCRDQTLSGPPKI